MRWRGVVRPALQRLGQERRRPRRIGARDGVLDRLPHHLARSAGEGLALGFGGLPAVAGRPATTQGVGHLLLLALYELAGGGQIAVNGARAHQRWVHRLCAASQQQAQGEGGVQGGGSVMQGWYRAG